MIDRQQLVAALERLDPREREVLDLSLRRRVPDDDLASVYGLDPADVARRRTAAIERLSADLDIQRGADLGHMLQALLEPETWEGVVLSDPEPLAADGEAQPEAEPAEIHVLEPEPEPVAEGLDTAPDEPEIETWPIDTEAEVEPEPTEEEPVDSELQPLPAGAEADGAAGAEPFRAEPDGAGAEPPRAEPEPPVADAEPAAAGPVLEMLGEQRASEQPAARKRRRTTAALAAAATVLLPVAGIVAASTLGDESGGDGDASSGSETRSFVPAEKGTVEQPFASDPEAVSGYTVARVGQSTVLRKTPGGKAKLRIPGRTEWNSARIMGVVRQRGEWLAVQVPELDNNEVGWLRASEARLSTVPWSLHVDLSNRQLTVRKDGRYVRRFPIAVGAPDHPTPAGRFSVTDKLRVADSGSPYGCCVLALSGHQTKLPPGWPGGDRLAVHATSDLTSIGRPVSLGCMRAETHQARWLLDTIPLGAPVFVRA